MKTYICEIENLHDDGLGCWECSECCKILHYHDPITEECISTELIRYYAAEFEFYLSQKDYLKSYE